MQDTDSCDLLLPPHHVIGSFRFLFSASLWVAVEHVPFILNKTQVECKSYRRPIDGVKRGILQRKTARYSNVIKNQLFGVQDLKKIVCVQNLFSVLLFEMNKLTKYLRQWSVSLVLSNNVHLLRVWRYGSGVNTTEQCFGLFSLAD